jgi:ADP-ribose pyrophosphatase YjhB (NUDIX family)
MYKVFIKNKVILFTNPQTKLNVKFNSLLRLNFFEKDTVPFLTELLSVKNRINGVVVCVDDVDAAFTEFKASFKVIAAAGGVVKNKESKTLFIYRLNKWDLPKGKVEKGEQIDEAAIREVEEECAVSELEIIRPLKDTFHIYTMGDELVLKQTYWFEMKTEFNGKLIPQTEEDIEEVRWMSDDDINTEVLANTYASIADFLNDNKIQ